MGLNEKTEWPQENRRSGPIIILSRTSSTGVEQVVHMGKSAKEEATNRTSPAFPKPPPPSW